MADGISGFFFFSLTFFFSFLLALVVLLLLLLLFFLRFRALDADFDQVVLSPSVHLASASKV